MHVPALVPTRFLTLMSHLILLVTIAWSRNENIKACLPWTYTEEEYDHKDNQLIAGLTLSVVFLVVELVGFLSGVTMFIQTQALISIASHSAGSVCLAYFVTDTWDCDLFWWIFGFCSALPVLAEIVLLIGVLGFKRLYK